MNKDEINQRSARTSVSRPENQKSIESKQNEKLAIRQNNQEDEEFSAELLADESLSTADSESDVSNLSIPVIGWIALVSSVISLFIMPFLFGGVGIITGIFARNRDAEWLGSTAIIIGVVAITLTLFITFI